MQACVAFCGSLSLQFHHVAGAIPGQANCGDHFLGCVQLD